VNGTLGNVRSYEFENYEEVYYCVMGGSWEVREKMVFEGRVFIEN